MTTNLIVISDALRELNVISEVATPSAEQGAHGLRKLNEMMEGWREDGVELGYFTQTLTTEDCPIPQWAEKGVKAKLALEVASTYGATVSAELVVKAEEAWQTILRKAIHESMRPSDMGHMPLGAGHSGPEYDITSG